MFPPPSATWVLMSGLPGDLESETSYRRQLQGWLEWLSTLSPPPARVFLLQDGSEPALATPQFPIKALASTRAAFLGLGAAMAGETNPLVVVAWGHGGMQSQKPVFHVRGPRITPADFQTVAGQLSNAPSSWVLAFRGSGRVASVLAGPGRQVLASELEVPFTNDPIGLPLLLAALQQDSTNSFDGLAEKWGALVAAWYDDRHLARTEEPSLWKPGNEPRRLIAPGKSPALASVPEAKPQPEAPEPSRPNAAPEAQPSEAWKDISPVDPRLHPEADTVILRRRSRITLGASPAIASEHEEFIQVLTPEGKHAGDFDVEYSPPDEELTVLDCEVRGTNGRVIRLPAEDMRDSAPAPVGDYRTGRRKYFSLPGVGPGTILHVRYRTEWRTYPMPHVSLALPVADEAPVVAALIEITVPKDSPFHFRVDHLQAADPAVRQSGHGTSYAWQFTNLPPMAAEALTPPHLQPALLFSTWPDWAAFAAWYGRISKGADERTPELTAKAQELAQKALTDREKVVAIYNYVVGLRYVMVPLGINSLRPHAAAHVFKNQYGDCKDKANLFNALLNAAGLDACLVLVPRFSQAHEAVPGLSFNHAISRVTLNGTVLWVDTTDDICRFGLLPPGDPGRNVLVIDGKETTLTALPLPLPADHRLELRGTVDLASATESAPVSLEVKATGYPDYEFREVARLVKGHRHNSPLLGLKHRPTAGWFSLSLQESTPVSDLGTEFTWKAKGEGMALASTSRAGLVLRAPFWIPKEWEAALQPRTTPLLINQGYPLQLDQTIVITLPAKTGTVSLPARQENRLSPLPWTVEWTQAGDGKVRAALKLELARGELSIAEVPEFQRQLTRLLTALADGCVF